MAKSIIRTIIIEDQPGCRKMLEDLLVPHESLEVVGSYGTAENALKEVIQKNPQLILLDVELPGKSGFEFLADLQRLNIHPCVIFTTAYDHYAIQAIKHAAFDYLLKPIDLDELALTINRFLSSSLQCGIEEKIDRLLAHVNPKNKLRFNTRQGFILISPNDIIYCQADWNYTEVYLGKEKKEVVTLNIGKVGEMLPSDQFFRINRSVMVNINFLEKLSRKNRMLTLTYSGDAFIFKVSKSRINEFKY